MSDSHRAVPVIPTTLRPITTRWRHPSCRPHCRRNLPTPLARVVVAGVLLRQGPVRCRRPAPHPLDCADFPC